MTELGSLHTFLLHFLHTMALLRSFFKGQLWHRFHLVTGISKTVPTFSSPLTPHLFIATSTVDPRFVITFSRLFICGITNFLARFRKNNLRLWVFPNLNSEFCVEKTTNAFGVATPSKLYHITIGHLFVCRLQLYVRISWSKVSTPVLVPLQYCITSGFLLNCFYRQLCHDA